MELFGGKLSLCKIVSEDFIMELEILKKTVQRAHSHRVGTKQEAFAVQEKISSSESDSRLPPEL